MADDPCRNCGHPLRLHRPNGDCTECATRCSHAAWWYRVLAAPVEEDRR